MPFSKASAVLGILTLAAVAVIGPAPKFADPMLATPQVEPRDFHYTFSSFGDVSVYRPIEAPKGVVIFLSDSAGWTPAMENVARSMVANGLLVAGVSTPKLPRALEAARKPCSNPNFQIIDLARDLQRRTRLHSYMKPVIIGYGSGATLAYTSVAMWPNGGYQGVISIDPIPSLPGQKPWCAAPGFATRRVQTPVPGWEFTPNAKIAIPWIAMQPGSSGRADTALLRSFVSSVPGARFVELARNETARSSPRQLGQQTSKAVQTLLFVPIAPTIPGQIPVPDMPITLVPAARGSKSDTMAIAYSGDGGWVGLDRDLAAQLAAAGIPVIGVDSLSYFWSARTPQGAGRDLSQLINAFSERWNTRKVLLIGYSFGADVLPYMIENIAPEARAQIAGVSLLGLSATGDFQFHLSSWLDLFSSDALPTVPAIVRLRGLPIRCIRGDQETSSACPAIPPGIAQQCAVPGGHHFDSNAPLLAHIVLSQTPATGPIGKIKSQAK